MSTQVRGGELQLRRDTPVVGPVSLVFIGAAQVGNIQLYASPIRMQVEKRLGGLVITGYCLTGNAQAVVMLSTEALCVCSC